jgi:hypothetical protein
MARWYNGRRLFELFHVLFRLVLESLIAHERVQNGEANYSGPLFLNASREQLQRVLETSFHVITFASIYIEISGDPV